jgi:integrase
VLSISRLISSCTSNHDWVPNVVKLFRRGKSKTSPWHFRITTTDPTGKKKRVTICTQLADKRAAEDFAAEYCGKQARIRSGLVSQAEVRQDAAAKSAIAEAHELFIVTLKNQRRSSQYVDDHERIWTELIESAGWQTIGDITEDGLVRYLQGLHAAKMSARTVQKAARAAKQFGRWLAVSGRLAADPFLRVKPPSPRVDRSFRRRMLLPTEWPWLVQAVRSKPIRYRMTSDERLALYDLAIQTGLRNDELRSLRVGDLYADAVQPYVTLGGEFTKDKKPAKQYIRRELAQLLRTLTARAMPEAPLLPLPRRWNNAKMLRDDLAEARRLWLAAGNTEPADFLEVLNSQQQILDFHSLRHTCGAWLALAGVQPKQIQTVMRHSTITLTLDTYGHLLPNTQHDAVEAQAKILGSQFVAAKWSQGDAG